MWLGNVCQNRGPIGLLMVCALVVGCTGIDRHDPFEILPDADSGTISEGNHRRQQFQIDRDPAALNWLLAHELDTGMSLAAVNEALGESGERVFDDEDLKRHANQYQQTDIGYKWGPDTKGRSVVLFFRDGKLVNFDPDEFRK
ncbi:MAG: hypothetical protein B7Z55_05675 [Planctomycetales bacterium 12-60-4]|nr:MAG: hypothetical protein B7Z55_05675 [Planctomycetales bacterium 12-60-4]